MVYNCDLIVGEHIDLEIEDDNGIKSSYASQVYNVLDQDHIEIAGPIKKGQIVVLQPGQILGIIYYRAEGCYRFYAKITRRYKTNSDIYIYTVEAIGSRERIQRRNYYRLEVVLPVRFRKLIESVDEDNSPLHKAYTLDISGGGMRIAVHKKISLKDNDLLQCIIFFDDKVELIVNGKVVRISSIDAESNMCEVGIEFKDMPDRIRDKLIRFIFKQQLKLIQKGLT